MKIWNATITALLSAALAAVMFVLPPNAAATGHASDTPPSAPANAQEQAARDAFTRILGSAASRFEITVPAQRPAGQDSYSVTTSGDKIRVTASTPSTAVAGLNHYLGSIGQSLSYTVRNVDPTVAFPLPDGELGRTANVAARYYGNDTEDGYTGAHRTFDQWERLIDELAALGFNQVFMPVGSEAVYFDVLRQFGYTAAEAAAWIPSPEHQPWWLLQNMASWPAGTTEASIEARAALGRRIADRLRELGMTPVLPGYFGTVPPGFVARNPGAVVVPQGGWVGFQRPDWLDPNSTVFPAVAAKFYESSATRLGRSTMYKMDLLHEGGQRGTADIPAATKRIEQALQATNPGATWVFLGWQSNPQNDIMGAVNPATTFIVDGITDRYPNGSRETAWLNRPWAYGTIWNYGGDTTIGAKLTRWNTDYFRFKDQAGSAMRGLAAMPEGGDNNGAALDFFANLAWVTGPVDLDQWWADYVFKRYGARDADAVAAWQIVSRTAYTLPTSGDFAEAHDSVYAAIPSLTAATSSQWSPTRPAYDITEFATALPRLLAASDRLGGNPAYRYDLMVLARQVLSNHGRVLLPEIRKAVSAGDLGQFDELTARWMEDMALVDQLAGTQEISLLGRLLDEARSAGTTVEQAAAFERNQRTLLTVWGPRAGYQSGLGDYAGREFQGLVGTYYQPRWQKFFDAHRAALTTGGAVAAFDWFDDAQPWLASADRTGIWSAPRGDVVALAQADRAAVERPL
ncbi:alpha-N-acetylglucosaminidase TIM-barrel domain-containing protein, partial [Tessaracoccus lubricantis]|uniref:alpha-N-acetylglucosaminidase n=1 Tax=Tessaracoccus lubricantis TaxID=545543 RepID=UPI003642DE6A